MLRKRLGLIATVGLVCSSSLLLTAVVKPMRVYESQTQVGGETITTDGSSVVIGTGVEQTRAGSFTFNVDGDIAFSSDSPVSFSAQECPSGKHLRIELEAGSLRIAAMRISARPYEDSGHSTTFTPMGVYEVPLWPLPVGFLALLSYTSVVSVYRIRRRRKLGLCLSCGYSLHGLTEPRCPECGTPFDDAMLKKNP